MPGDIFITNDVNLEDYSSELLKYIGSYRTHTAIGDACDALGLYFHDRKSFFHFDGDGVSLYPDVLKTDKPVAAIYAPCLRSVYVIKMFRGRGVQHDILKEVITASEETGEPFYAIADPFVITGSRYETSGEDALYKFLTQDYERPKDFDKQLSLQKRRFETAGLFNIEIEDCVRTKPEQHYLYIPSTATDEEKETGKTLRR